MVSPVDIWFYNVQLHMPFSSAKWTVRLLYLPSLRSSRQFNIDQRHLWVRYPFHVLLFEAISALVAPFFKPLSICPSPEDIILGS